MLYTDRIEFYRTQEFENIFLISFVFSVKNLD